MEKALAEAAAGNGDDDGRAGGGREAIHRLVLRRVEGGGGGGLGQEGEAESFPGAGQAAGQRQDIARGHGLALLQQVGLQGKLAPEQRGVGQGGFEPRMQRGGDGLGAALTLGIRLEPERSDLGGGILGGEALPGRLGLGGEPGVVRRGGRRQRGGGRSPAQGAPGRGETLR